MRLKPNRGVLFLCLVFLYIGQTCGISLEIVERYETHREKKSEDVHAGTITFGGGDISLFRNLEYERRYVGENTIGGSGNIQADDPRPVLVGEQITDDFRSSKAAWDRMRPKLLCTKDLMKFSAQGPGYSSLQLDRSGQPLPLSQLPQDCGYSVYRSLVGIVFLAPLDGCDVIQQGNSHLLQMLWHGNPVTLSCPVSSSDQVSPVDPKIEHHLLPGEITPQSTLAPTAKAVFSTITEAPSTAATLPPQNQQQQQWMQHLIHYGGYNPFIPVTTPPQTIATPTTEAPSTAATLPPQNQQQQQWMQQQWMQHLIHYGGYNPFIPVTTPPQTTATPSTEAPSTTEEPTTAATLPQQQQQWIHPHIHYGGYYNPFIPVTTPPQTTTAPTTKAPTTTAKLPPQNQQQQQWMQHLVHYGGYNPLMPVTTLPQTTVAPTTEAPSATEAPTTASKLPPQNQQQQQWIHPLIHFGGYNPVIPVTTSHQTTAAPTTKAPTTAAKLPPQNQQQQQWMQHLVHYGGYNPLMPVTTLPQTTVAPTTEAPSATEAPTTASKLPPQNQQQQQWIHPLIHFGGYNPVIPVTTSHQTTAVPTTKAPTTAAKLPPQNQQQQQWMQQQWMQHLHNGDYNPLMPVTTLPQTTAASTSEVPPQSQQEPYPGYYNPGKPSPQDQQFMNLFRPPAPASTAAPLITPTEPTTPFPDDESTSAAPPNQSPLEEMPYSKYPFKPFLVEYVNPSDPNMPKPKTKSWTQVLSQNYPFMSLDHSDTPNNHAPHLVDEDKNTK
ncbi:mucin-5AC-like [Alosa sapidissima]|uniref:mucin-5AC-like n=1 Tax=Alosa sapidissima TaxID=34773 RepID=UPI001C0A3865|nr:mucin-5AC-like [Alosa sapidissima]